MEPHIIRREDHPISRKDIDPDTLRVLYKLKDAGFEAYLVGGAVRDLLLGRHPKDFDLATDARPHELRKLFRNSRVVGRRFRIVHVFFGSKNVEVATLRSMVEPNTDGDLYCDDDNQWGDLESDSFRRDFTVNALYYDPQRQLVVDYHGGLADARARTLRMIGDPETRYREDPVRIIRAVRFAAKLNALGFKFEDKTVQPLKSSVKLLLDVPQSRLFDEMLKLLQTGHALASIEQLKTLGLTGIYPLLDVVVSNAHEPFLNLALQDTDRRVSEDKPVAPSFLLSCILWADVRDGWNQRMGRGEHTLPALHDAIDDAFNAKIGDVSGRGKLGGDMREIWAMQIRFDKRVGSSPYSMLEQPRFRAGFDFLRLRAQTGEVDMELAEWWEKFSTAYDDERHVMIETMRLANLQKPQQARVRVKKVDAPLPDVRFAEPTDSAPDANQSQGEFAPARKRRRRRKPVNRGEGGTTGPAPD